MIISVVNIRLNLRNNVLVNFNLISGMVGHTHRPSLYSENGDTRDERGRFCHGARYFSRGRFFHGARPKNLSGEDGQQVIIEESSEDY